MRRDDQHHGLAIIIPPPDFSARGRGAFFQEAPVNEALECFGECRALDLERFGQGQDRAIISLGSGGKNHELAVG